MKRYNKKYEYNGSRRRESVMPRPRGRIRKRIALRMYKSRRCWFSRATFDTVIKPEPVPVSMLASASAHTIVLICIINLSPSILVSLSLSLFLSLFLFLPSFFPLSVFLFFFSSFARTLREWTGNSECITRYPSRIAHLSGGKIRSVS